jgi:hypothetical protein
MEGMLVEKLTGVRVEQLVVDYGRASGVTVVQLVVVVMGWGGGGYRQEVRGRMGVLVEVR